MINCHSIQLIIIHTLCTKIITCIKCMQKKSAGIKLAQFIDVNQVPDKHQIL